MRRRDYFDPLLLPAEGYKQKYPKGHPPFQMMTRLCEEVGERASSVNHGEDTGRRKELKHGPPDRKALTREVQDVIPTALSSVR